MALCRIPPEQLTALARDCGFDLAGIAATPPRQAADHSYFDQWIAAGHAGEMDYLKRRNHQGHLLRSDLHAAFPWAQSVIVCAKSYAVPGPASLDPAPPEAGWIARYAWSGRAESPSGELRPSDYHDVLLGRLRGLERRLQSELGPFESRAYVDTGPVIEREWAAAAGVGWTGKNTCILHQELGSWLFLGVLVTSLEVAPEALAAPAADRCGTCRRCIDACPTGALTGPREMDASLCISYLTIEKRGPIPEHLRAPLGRHVFGCDICQDVCPWNRKLSRPPPTPDRELTPRSELINPALDWLASLDAQAFNRIFRGSPVKRAKHAGVHRNVAIAMGNSGDHRFLNQLDEWSHSPDPVLADAAQWAIARLRSPAENAPQPSPGPGRPHRRPAPLDLTPPEPHQQPSATTAG
jgi:epoxyqueuosine reductase